MAKLARLQLAPAELQAVGAKFGGAAGLQCTASVANWSGAVARTAARPLVNAELQWGAAGEETTAAATAAAAGRESSAEGGGQSEPGPLLLDGAGKEGFECFGDELRLQKAPTALQLDLFVGDDLLQARHPVTHHAAQPPPQ